MMINVNEVIEKFEENKQRRPTSEELGLHKEDFRKAANELVEELREEGADLDWWMGTKTRTEPGIIQLGPEPPNVSVERACELVDIKYETLMRLVQDKLDENLGVSLEGAREKGEKIKEMKENLEEETSIIGQMELAGKLTAITEHLKGKDPENKPLWVALLLKAYGEEEVSIERWFRVHWLFDRIVKAETARRADELSGGFMSSLFGGT